MSIVKDKYLTPAHSLKSTRSTQSTQYCRYQTYSDALKNSLFHRLFHSGISSGIGFLLWWSIPRPLNLVKRTAKRFFFSQNSKIFTHCIKKLSLRRVQIFGCSYTRQELKFRFTMGIELTGRIELTRSKHNYCWFL